MKTNVQTYRLGVNLSKAGLPGKGKLRALISFSLSILILGLFAKNATGQNSAIFTSSTSWTCPAGVTCVKVEAWGAGGGGSRITSTNLKGGGGGGGAYASSFITVIPGNSYNITVGTGGASNNNGGDSWFINNITLMAKGGIGGTNNSATAGAGGSATTSVGTIKYSGGAGATGSTSSGGGGGGAGSTGAGGPASGATAGLGTAANGGNGGTGVSSSNNGNSGNNYGGGGSGASTNSGADRNGGLGAGGRIKLTWVNISSFSTSASSPLCSNTASTVTVSSFSLATDTYTVTYDLSGANSATGNTASMNFIGTTGTFTTSPLTNGGATTITITGIAFAGPVCNTAVSSGNTASITVNTTPSVSATPASQTSCTGTAITQIDITNPNNVAGTIFTWTRTTHASLSGIANSGSGSSISGTFTNSSNAPITTTFTITATAGGCSSSTTVTVTVNPIPNVSVTNANQTICSGTAITDIVITNPNNVAGVTFNWIRDNTANLSGLISGTGSPISGILTNNTLVQQTTEFAISASLGNCSSITIIATVMVNPGPSVSATPSSQTVCTGTAFTQIDITDLNAIPGTTFSWTRTTAFGLSGVANSGTGSTISGTFNNSNGFPVTTTFTITASNSGCTSTTTVTVTVNPAPTISATNTIQTVCSGTAISNIVISNPNGVSGAAFTWTRDNSINLTGIAASGSGSPISGTLTNNTGVQQTTVFTISVSAGGCTGATTTATVIVNPRPTINATPATQTICSGTAISQINISNPNTVAGTTFTWTRDNTVNLTGIASSGAGAAITGNLTNTTTVQQTTIFTITATAGSCSSTTTVSVIVNPSPVVNVVANMAFCNNGNGTAINFGSNVAGSTFAWTSTANVGFGLAGTGNIPAYTAANGPVTATVSVTATVNGCTGPVRTFTITINALPTITVSADYCIVPGKVRLTANPLPAGSYAYLWSTGATTSVIDIDIAGSYTVTVTNANGCQATNSISIATELAVNGNFEAGNFGFTSGFLYNASANGLQPEGRYAVNENPNFNHTNFWGRDHTTATGKMMIVNGLVGPTVWQETVTVVPNTTYYFSAWAMSLNNLPPYAQLQFSVNGSTIGVSAVLVAGVNNNALNTNWQRFYGTWSSGALTTATCAIVDLQGALGGNDFALDDISISTLSPAPYSVYPSVLGGGTSVCQGSTLNLSPNQTGGSSPFTFSWTGPAGFTSNLQNPSIPNVTAANSGTYTVTSTDFYGCVVSSNRVITVGLPAAPTPVTATPAAICLGSSSNLNGTAATGTQSDFTGFYAPGNWSTTNNPGLTGGSVNTSTAPTSISITSGDNTFAGNTDFTITNGAVAGNFVFTWNYRSNELASNDIPQYSINGAAAVNFPGFNTSGANIQSGTASIAVPANQTFALRMRTVTGTSGSATTTISNFSGPLAGTITWFTVPSGGSSIGNSISGANFSVTPAAAGISSYYAEGVTSIGCVSSSRTLVNVTVNQPSAAATSLTASPNIICNGSSSTLTQSGGSLGTGASWKWYSNSSYTTLVGTGVGATASLLVSPGVTTTYYLRAEGTSSPCTANVNGPGAGVTVTVRQPSVAATGLNASPATICSGSSSTLTQTGGSLGTGASWKWYSDASYTTLAGTGVGATASLSVSPIATTTYYLRIEGTSSPCTANATGPVAGVTVTVNQPSAAATALSASPNTICNGSSTTLTQSGGSLGTGASWKWYSDASYTTLVGTGVGATASLPVSPIVTTTYYLRAEGATAPCASNVAGPMTGVTVTVRQPSVAPTALNATPNPICNGGSATLTQSGGSLGTAASWKWYSNASYTTLVGTGVGATASLSVSPLVTTTYYLRVEGTSTPCTANANGPGAGVTVVVNQKSANPTSATGLPTEICNGSSTVLTLVGGGGGDNETIVWYTGSCGGTVAGTGNNLTVSPAITTTYFGRYENAAPCNYSSSCVQVTITVKGSGTWLGLNNNWHDPVNWCGGVPTSSTNVNIPFIGTGIYPVVSLATAMSNDIALASGTSLTVNGQTLQVAGAISNSGGVFDVLNGGIELNGTAGAQSIAGSLFVGKTIKDLRISNTNGVNLSGVNDTLKLSGVVKFGVDNAILTTNNNLTLLSSAIHTASVGDMTNNGANSGNNIIGNVTVERFIPNHFKAWQFLAVPTKGQTVNAAWQEGNIPLSNSNNPGYGTNITSNVPGAVALGFDVYTPAGPTMKTYDSTTNGWVGISSPGIQIANQKGYMLFVRGDRSVTVFNQPATSTILRTTGQLYTIGADAPSVTNLDAGTFESIGNPYASAIDFDKVTKTGGTQDIFYVWDPKLTTSTYSAWGLGAYQTFVGPGPEYTIVPGGGSYTGDNTKIESGQAFFVHAPFDPGSVSFSELCKVDGSNVVTRPSNAQVKQLRNNLYIFTGGNPVLLDGTLSQFDAAYSNAVDEMDAVKITNSSENLGLSRDGKRFVAERRGEIERTDTIFYNLGQLRVQQYQFEFIAANLAQPGLTAFLEDSYLQTSTVVSLHDTTRVMFNVINEPGSYAPDRFRLVFQRLVPTPVSITSITASRNSDKTISVNWKVENETNMQLYTIERSEDGRNFSGIVTADPVVNNGGSAVYSRNDLSPLVKDNFYRIKALSFGGQIQYSSIVKLAPVRSTPGITVYPNPVIGKTMQLQFTDQPTGKYSIVLLYSNGMQQKLADIKVNASQSSHSVMLPQLLASGIYHLQITGPSGESILKTVHIETN